MFSSLIIIIYYYYCLCIKLYTKEFSRVFLANKQKIEFTKMKKIKTFHTNCELKRIINSIELVLILYSFKKNYINIIFKIYN